MRIRRVTYDLGNVIERQEYLDGRYGAILTIRVGSKVWSTGREESQEEESHTGGSGAGQPVDQGEESQTQTSDVFQGQ